MTCSFVICPPKIPALKGNNRFKWAYLGEDVTIALEIENRIGGRGERINIADTLQAIVKSLRRSYIDYVGELNVGLPNWWATTISEKNPFISRAFLYICYLRVCEEILKNNQSEHVVIFVENRALRKTIFKNYLNKYKIKYIEDRSGFNECLKHRIESIAEKTYFVLINVMYILLVKVTGKYKHQENKPSVLMREWIDFRSFDSCGCYQSAYLGKLGEYLKSNGKSVVILPYIWNINKKTLKQIIKANESFIIPHSFISIINVLSKVFVKTPVLRSYPFFENLDVTWLIQEDFKKDDTRFIEALLYYDLIQNLNSAKFCFESCIYLYENYMDEKIFCMGMEKYYPSAVLIGYQHATAPKMLLPYFFSSKESKIMPFPHKIITNGPYFTRLFIDEGYPKGKIITGGAIRYSYLYDKYDFNYSKNNIKNTYNILVTSSASINGTLELLNKIIKAFGGEQKYRVTIKYHPTLNPNTIKKYIQKFPSNINISGKSVPELLRENDLMIYTFTGSCIEALYVGVPVLHVKSDYIIDLDLFDYEQNNIYSAKNVNEIIQMSNELLQMDETQIKSRQTMWKKVVEDMFKPVDESTYRLFINTNE